MLCERFAEKCLKNIKTKKMFQERKKVHKMNLRNKEKYEVAHANTVRLQMSAIPTMTRHLNLKHNTERNIYQSNS